MEDNTDFIFTFEDADDDITMTEDNIDITPEASVEAPEEAKEEEAGNETPEEVEGLTEEQKAEYLVIYDAIMFEDRFEKTYNLGSKYSVTLATRSADADLNISRQLDTLSFSTMHAFRTMSAVFTMSHSIMQLCGTDTSKMKVADRYKFIRGKSSHLIELLSNKMVEFDNMVRDALEYGETNF